MVLVPDARRITHTTAVKILTIFAFIYAPLNTAISIYGIEHAADQQQWTQHLGLHHYSRYRPSHNHNVTAHDGRNQSNQSLA